MTPFQTQFAINLNLKDILLLVFISLGVSWFFLGMSANEDKLPIIEELFEWDHRSNYYFTIELERFYDVLRNLESVKIEGIVDNETSNEILLISVPKTYGASSDEVKNTILDQLNGISVKISAQIPKLRNKKIEL
jgi:hypothetical protein